VRDYASFLAKCFDSHRDRVELYKELCKKSDKDITEMRLHKKDELDQRQIRETRMNSRESIVFTAEWFLLSLLFLAIHGRLYHKSTH
jgi:hypothetical protein